MTINTHRDSPLRRRLRFFWWRRFNAIENNNNPDRRTNGERRFLREHLGTVSGQVVVFDVGANMGDYSADVVQFCDATRRDYRLHLFEPTRFCAEALRRRYAADPTRVFVNPVGASDVRATRAIFFNAAGSSLASLYRREIVGANVSLNQEEEINLIPLSDYIARLGLTRVDLMKIDVEGHELSVLRGMGHFLRPQIVRAIQFEYGGANLDSKTTLRELMSFLIEHGYEIGKIMRRSVSLRRYETWMDNFQYSNHVALAPDLIR